MKVHKVQHTLTRTGLNLGHCVTDMIHIDGSPHLVFEWSKAEDGSLLPLRLVKLDPQYLHEGHFGIAEYLYEFPVEEPQTDF